MSRIHSPRADSSRPHRLAAVLVAAAGLLLACGPTLPELPELDTSDMEPAVAERITSLREKALGAPSAETLTEFGVALLVDRRYAAAEPVLLLAELSDGADRFRLLHLAGIAASARSLDDAVRHMERACAIRDDYVPCHVKCGIYLEELGRLDEAEEHLRAALAVEREPHALLGMGRVELARRRPRAATLYLEEARSRNRALLEASVALAQAYAAVGAFDKAAAAGEEAAALRSPTHMADPILDAALDTAVSYAGRLASAARAASAGDAQRAFDHVDAAIRSDPLRVDGHLAAGILFAQAGRHADALQALGRVLVVEPRHTDALLRQSTSLALTGQEPEAEAALRAAVASADDSAKPSLELARFLETRAPDEALTILEAIFASEAPTSDSRLLMARLLTARGRHAEAAEHVEAVLRRFPEDQRAAALRDAIEHAMR